MRLPDERLCLKSILLRPFSLQSLNATAPWHFEKKKKNCLQKLSSPSPPLSTKDMIQDPRRMPETVDSTTPYMLWIFIYVNTYHKV